MIRIRDHRNTYALMIHAEHCLPDRVASCVSAVCLRLSAASRDPVRSSTREYASCAVISHTVFSESILHDRESLLHFFVSIGDIVDIDVGFAQEHMRPP